MSVNFFRGHPTDRLLATAEILKGCQQLLGQNRNTDDNEEDRHPLQYGTDPGSQTVRQLIADWSHQAFGEQKYGPAHGDWLNLTNGASFGAREALLQCTSASTGHTVQGFIICPTYYLINAVFHDCGFHNKLTAVPETREKGIDLGFFEQQLKKFESQEQNITGQSSLIQRGCKVFKYVLYLVPTFSNPRGSTLSLEARQRIVELARKYDVLVISDDVYELLDYRHINEGDNSPLPPRLVTFDRLSAESDSYGNVISNCTFSKYLGPGFRVGWQETVGSKLAAQLCSGGAVRSGGTPAQMNTMIAAELIKNGDIDKVIANVCAVLADRSKAMQENLVSYLPEGTIVEGGNGGYFLWVTLPDKYNVEEITQKCAQRNVILAPEKNFQVADKSLNFDKVKQHSFRVSISFHEKNEYIQGLKVWAQVCKEHVI